MIGNRSTRNYLTAAYDPKETQNIPGMAIFYRRKSFWNTFLKFLGPGYLIAVGYIDPGNWATDIEGGSNYGYSLLSVILFSNICAVLFQSHCIKLGVVSGADLARQCRESFPRWLNYILYALAEVSIIATDLANVLGSAIALKLLFSIPLIWSVLITGLDVMIILKWWGDKYQRYYEAFVFALILGVMICFCIQIGYTQPPFVDILRGYLPDLSIITDSGKLFQTVSIIGATVMPHNLYLHSAVCKNRRLLIVDAEDVDVSTNNNNNNNNNNTDQADCQEDVPFSDEGTVDDDEKTSIGNDETNHRSFDESADSEELLPDSDETRLSDSVWMTIKFSIFDTLIALTFAFIINSTILIVGASAFNSPDGSKDAEGLEEAYAILKQYVGPVAATCFAIALLMSGQSSSITGTLAGEIVMSGFLDLRIRPAIRRVVTRLCAIIPAVISILAFGGNGEKLIVYSQVILSAQLPFAIFPLIYFTGTPKLMKISRNTDFSNGIILTLFSYFCGVIITGLNMYLSLAQIASG